MHEILRVGRWAFKTWPCPFVPLDSDSGLIPGLGRSPGEGNGYPLQCSGLECSSGSQSRTGRGDFHFHLQALQALSSSLSVIWEWSSRPGPSVRLWGGGVAPGRAGKSKGFWKLVVFLSLLDHSLAECLFSRNSGFSHVDRIQLCSPGILQSSVTTCCLCSVCLLW